MQAPLVAPLVANRVNAPAVNEGGGFMSESDDSENDAISIFSDISTATGGGESDHSDQSEGAQSDLSATSIGEPRSAAGSDLNQERDATLLGSNSVANASSGVPVVKEDSCLAKNVWNSVVYGTFDTWTGSPKSRRISDSKHSIEDRPSASHSQFVSWGRFVSTWLYKETLCETSMRSIAPQLAWLAPLTQEAQFELFQEESQQCRQEVIWSQVSI